MNRLISASAGSGKTHVLTTQYLSLLHARYQEVLSGKEAALRVDSLLAATFTRKAAGEIFDRILKRLADAALAEKGLADLRESLCEPSLSAETCQDLLLHLCRNLHRVQVGTLDSFFQRLCQVYKQEAGLSGNLRMTSPTSPSCVALQKTAIAALLAEMDDLDEVDALLQTLTGPKASSPVIPKLLTLLQGISESVGDAEPGHWEQLQVPICPSQSEIDNALANLEHYSTTLVKDQWKKAVSGDLQRFRDQQWEGFFAGGLAKPCHAGTCTYYKVQIPEEQVSAYEVLLAAARHTLLSVLKQQTLALRDVHTRFSEKFIEARKAEGFVLFSETPSLLNKVVGSLAETARRLDSPLKHLLLDEFQDTSDPQWGLLRSFAVQAACAPGSVLMVGDAKQAIYGWRGGRAEIFDQIENDIDPLERETLEKSYRSSEIVLDVVNTVFQDIAENRIFQPVDASDAKGLTENEKIARHRATAAQWAAYFKPQVAAQPRSGFVELCVSPVPPDPSLPTPVGDRGEHDTEDTDDGGEGWGAAGASHHIVQCAARIAGEAKKLLARGRSVGVLMRTNKTVAQMTDLLRAGGVPVSSEGVGKIADDPAVELLLSALLLADHPGHTAAAYHVSQSPLAAFVGLEPADYSDVSKIAQVAADIRRQILFQGYTGVLTLWAATLAPYGLERTAQRLEQLLEMAAGFDALPPMRPSEFVRSVRESSAENPGASPVRVMTINRAKGLEFDAVFLPDLEWKTRASDQTCLVKRASVQAISAGGSAVEAIYARPSATVRQLAPELLALTHADEADEVTGMLCLLYVAMTRPHHALHLYVAPHKLKLDGTPEKPGIKPSAILRAAFCGSATYPAQGADWVSLIPERGRPDWHEMGEATREMPAATMPPARPSLTFRASDGIRRGASGSAPDRQEAVKPVTKAKTAADLLQLH